MSPNLFCNLNSQLLRQSEAVHSSADDGFRLRYGLYETYLYKDNELEFASLHWERLLNGMQVLGFTIPESYSEAFFTKQIQVLAQQNGLEQLCRIRLQVFSDDTAAPYQAQYLIECFALDQSMTGWLENGIKIEILPDFEKAITASANCKISHNKHFIPARAMMEAKKLDDVLLLNEHGNVIESGMANLFWVKDGTVFTPPLSEGCLAGTIRAVVIAYIKAKQIPFEEKAVRLSELKEADELFLTNGIRKIRWIREMGGKMYGNEVVKATFKNMLAS